MRAMVVFLVCAHLIPNVFTARYSSGVLQNCSEVIGQKPRFYPFDRYLAPGRLVVLRKEDGVALLSSREDSTEVKKT